MPNYQTYLNKEEEMRFRKACGTDRELKDLPTEGAIRKILERFMMSKGV